MLTDLHGVAFFGFIALKLAAFAKGIAAAEVSFKETDADGNTCKTMQVKFCRIKSESDAQELLQAIAQEFGEKNHHLVTEIEVDGSFAEFAVGFTAIEAAWYVDAQSATKREASQSAPAREASQSVPAAA